MAVAEPVEGHDRGFNKQMFGADKQVTRPGLSDFRRGQLPHAHVESLLNLLNRTISLAEREIMKCRYTQGGICANIASKCVCSEYRADMDCCINCAHYLKGFCNYFAREVDNVGWCIGYERSSSEHSQSIAQR